MEMSTNVHQTHIHRDPSGAFLSNVRTDTWRQFRHHDFPPRRFVIEPLLYERQVAMVYAATGVGKTWFTLSLAATAASGRGANFLGFRSNGDGERVLLVDGEMDAEDLKERIALVIKAIGADEEAVDRNLSIMSRQHQSLTNDFPDIADEHWQDNLLRSCKSKGIKLLVLDNLSTLAPSIGDENSAAQMQGLNTMLLKAKQSGVACLLVHHSNKTNGSYRGSSAMTVTLDIVRALKRPDKYTPIDGETTFAIDFEKVRGRIPREITAPRTVVFKTSDGTARWEEDDHSAAQGAHLRPLLETLEFTSQRELADHERCSPATMSRKIREAIAAEVFTKEEMQDWFRRARDLRKARQEPAGNDDLDGPTSTLQLHQGRSQSAPQGATGDPVEDAGDTSDPTYWEEAREEAVEELTPRVPSGAPVEPKELDARMF